MKSRVFSALVKLRKTKETLPEKYRGRFDQVFRLKQKQVFQEFKNWEKELNNCLDFLGVQNSIKLKPLKVRLFPKDSFDSAIIIQRTIKIKKLCKGH